MAAAHIQSAVNRLAVPTVVLGLGKTGWSCVRFLQARGVPVSVADSRGEPPYLAELKQQLPQVPVHVGGFSAALRGGVQRLVVSPGISVHEPAIAAAQANGAEIIGDIELFAWFAHAPVVAITGSNGKSTVTTLVGAMAQRAGLRAGVGGNLGTPALDLLQNSEPDCYVLELSSFQLETTSTLNARAAVVLNLSSDHMDRYPGMAEYAAAKQRVFRGDGVMVINADDTLVMAMVEPGREVVSFTLGVPVAGQYGIIRAGGEEWLAFGSERLLAVSELRIAGRHNQANALAALALGSALGLPRASMLEELRQFAGLPHRTQWVASINGVSWYNDSKGTNVGATLAAIAGLPGRLVLIAGGQGKGQDFSPLRAAVQDKVSAVVLLGEDAPKIADALTGATRLVRVGSMEEAVLACTRLAEVGDSVLLSPACASFDMFNGYDHRGRVFAAAVQGLQQ